MTIQAQIARIEQEITEFMAILPTVTIQENKTAINAHIIQLSHELCKLRDMEVNV